MSGCESFQIGSSSEVSKIGSLPMELDFYYYPSFMLSLELKSKLGLELTVCFLISRPGIAPLSFDRYSFLNHQQRTHSGRKTDSSCLRARVAIN